MWLSACASSCESISLSACISACMSVCGYLSVDPPVGLSSPILGKFVTLYLTQLTARQTDGWMDKHTHRLLLACVSLSVSDTRESSLSHSTYLSGLLQPATCGHIPRTGYVHITRTNVRTKTVQLSASVGACLPCPWPGPRVSVCASLFVLQHQVHEPMLCHGYSLGPEPSQRGHRGIRRRARSTTGHGEVWYEGHYCHLENVSPVMSFSANKMRSISIVNRPV